MRGIVSSSMRGLTVLLGFRRALTRSEQEIVGCESDDAGAQDLEVGTGIAIDVATHPSVDAGLIEPQFASLATKGVVADERAGEVVTAIW
jgi:hypothetical protein